MQNGNGAVTTPLHYGVLESVASSQSYKVVDVSNSAGCIMVCLSLSPAAVMACQWTECTSNHQTFLFAEPDIFFHSAQLKLYLRVVTISSAIMPPSFSRGL